MNCYKGHGQAGTGNWCFQDGTLSILDIQKLVGGQYPLIIADCCFSGHWSDQCSIENQKGQTTEFHTLSAAPAYSAAIDHSGMYYYVASTVYYSSSLLDGGGELTQWITGKGGRPSTEPMYSAGSSKGIIYLILTITLSIIVFRL